MTLSASEEGQLRDLLGRLRTSSWSGTPLLGGLPTAVMRTALPTAAKELDGVICFVPGVAGVADGFWICEKSAADTYSWRALDTPAGVDLSAIDFLVGTASGLLSGEIVAGTAPGGELGGSWASPTVDTTHSGSAHSQILRYSNTAEVTTTSTGAVDLLTSSAISIPVTSGIIIEAVYRKTTGAAVACNLGLKLNSTVVNEAGGTGDIARTSALNSAEDGFFRCEIGPRSANYLRAGISYYSNFNSGPAFLPAGMGATAAFPNATITSIAIRGISGSALVTLAIKECAIYEVLWQ